jgi:hypothetical protein
VLPFRRKGAPLSGATVPAPCQMRSKTENPCPHPAVVEIRGVAFCGPCAREQEAYFAIGELVARGEARGLRSKPLAEALERLRRERGRGSVAEGRPEPPGVDKAERLELTMS